MPSDGLELIRRIAGGDRDAFSAFYDAYAPLAFGVLCRVLRSDAQAEAVLLDVFGEVWQSAGDWAPRRGGPEAWVGELAAAHALGSLGRDDLARFQAHLAGCAECEQLLVDYREALVGFAADLRQPPPRRAKRGAMAGVDRRGARGARERFWSGLRWAASVAVAAGLLASVAATYVSGRYEGRLGQMAR